MSSLTQRPKTAPDAAKRLRAARTAYNDSHDRLLRATLIADDDARRLYQAEIAALAAGHLAGVRSGTLTAWRRQVCNGSVLHERKEEVADARSAAGRPDMCSGSTVRAEHDRGSLTVFYMVICLALFVVTGLGIDGGRMLTLHGQAVATAATAAHAAAAAPLSQQVAVAEAAAAADNMTVTGFPPAPPGQVCVSVTRTEKTWILPIVGINHFTANETQCAS